jgi:hypothetical protein
MRDNKGLILLLPIFLIVLAWDKLAVFVRVFLAIILIATSIASAYLFFSMLEHIIELREEKE